jgi:hypothetical protein
MTTVKFYRMATDDAKPIDPKPRKPVRPWVAWLMAFVGVNPGYKPWETKPPSTPPAEGEKKPRE